MATVPILGAWPKSLELSMSLMTTLRQSTAVEALVEWLGTEDLPRSDLPGVSEEQPKA